MRRTVALRRHLFDSRASAVSRPGTALVRSRGLLGRRGLPPGEGILLRPGGRGLSAAGAGN